VTKNDGRFGWSWLVGLSSGFLLGSMMLISIKKDNVEAGFMGFRAGFIGSWM
jgi:hypothetical protein